MAKGLTDKRILFCEEYLIDFNGTRAYKVAYPNVVKDSTAASAAARLLRNVKVIAYLDKRKAEIAEKLEITPERTLRAFARRAYFDPRSLINADGNIKPLHRMNRDTAAAVTEIKVHRLDTKIRKVDLEDGEDGIETTEESLVTIKWDKGDSAREALAKYQGLFEKDNLQRRESALDEILRALPEPVREALREKISQTVKSQDDE